MTVMVQGRLQLQHAASSTSGHYTSGHYTLGGYPRYRSGATWRCDSTCADVAMLCLAGNT